MLSASRLNLLITGPLFLWTALVILFACRKVSRGQTDPWRLTWLLIQATAPVSFACYLASLVWYKRLHATYPRGMKDVNAIYFQPEHPLARYVKDEPTGGFGIPLQSLVFTSILVFALVTKIGCFL